MDCFTIPHPVVLVKRNLSEFAPQRKVPAAVPTDGGGNGPNLFCALAVGGLHAALMVEDALADAQALGRDLEQLVVREEL